MNLGSTFKSEDMFCGSTVDFGLLSVEKNRQHNRVMVDIIQ